MPPRNLREPVVITMQKHHFYYLLFLLWFSYLIASSLLLFTKGFLLTRVTLPHNSTCRAHRPAPQTCPERHGCDDEADSTCRRGRPCGADLTVMDGLYDASRTCLPQRARAVLLVVDALRYDFAVYDPDNEAPAAYQNKLTTVRDALREFPDSARLYRFVADPPTTTMQRLKALTTGSLPTFIDAGANFAATEINEDNLIDQVSFSL